jgi:hypothetical protein
MATQDGKRKRKRSQPLDKYFYLEGELHRRLHVQPGTDILTAWNYPQYKRLGYSYSDIKRRAERAFKTVKVAEMLNRSRLSLELAIIRGDIHPPQKTYHLETWEDAMYLWSEKDILEAHAYFKTVHKGRPRKDGLITPQLLPSERELRAMIKGDSILYVKNEDGEFIPSWRARI